MLTIFLSRRRVFTVCDWSTGGERSLGNSPGRVPVCMPGRRERRPAPLSENEWSSTTAASLTRPWRQTKRDGPLTSKRSHTTRFSATQNKNSSRRRQVPCKLPTGQRGEYAAEASRASVSISTHCPLRGPMCSADVRPLPYQVVRHHGLSMRRPFPRARRQRPTRRQPRYFP